MHCIVPFAAPATEAGRAALKAMQWPRLSALLPRLALVDRDEAEPTTFSPPHERVLARALGWRADAAALPADVGSSGGRAGGPRDARLDDSGDGCWPFAARAARADGVEVGNAAWGLVSPVHWHVGTDQVSLADPEMLQLDDAASRTLFQAVQPLFADDGMAFVYGHATRWYVAHESLQGLRTAALDRVVGRNVDPWLDEPVGAGSHAVAMRRWRRLQAEVQMLLHSHPLNAEREARGLLPVNSFWLSGCGRALPEPAGPVLQVDASLRAAALAEDWPLWSDAWRRFEESTLLGLEVAMRRGAEVWLTLAGERAAVTFVPQRGGLLARLRSVLARPAVPELLASL